MSTQHFTLLESAARLYWTQLDSPVARDLLNKSDSGDWRGVLDLTVDPRRYVDPLTYHRDVCAVSFLKKNPYVKGYSEEERSRAALEKWEEGERMCFHTNQRMRLLKDARTGPLWEFLTRVRGRILDWIGTGVSDKEMQDLARHGPGSTFSSLARSPTAADKYSEKPTLTGSAVWYLTDIVGTLWGAEMANPYVSSYRDCVQIVDGNRYAAVPKTAKTHRSIAIEPSINVYFQLAVGTALRKRLRKRCWWDLDNAATIHRKVARQASIDGSYATLDLSNASDTNALELVRVLFEGTNWLERMEDLRSKKTLVNGSWRLLEKFSSMGNGYTFELETVIFAAICSVVLEIQGLKGRLGVDLFVFGDDIIVPSEVSALVQSALRFCGFAINHDKSFDTGHFRESCGGDFFLGHPVRGYFLKREPDEPDVCYSLHNGAKKALDACVPDGTRFLSWVLSRLPTVYRSIGGSDRLGDSVLHGLPARRVKWKGGIRWVRAVKWNEPILVDWRFFTPSVRLACRLTGYGGAFGISSRGTARSGEVIWVTDS